MRTGNTQDGVLVNPAFEWKVFDCLPKCVRRVISESPTELAVVPIAREYVEARQLGMSPEYFAYELAKHVRK